MKSFFVLILTRIGYTGEPDSLCISALPAWPLLFLTGGFAVLAVSVLVRSILDMVAPPGVAQRVAGSRSVIHWSVNVTAMMILAAVIEAAGAQHRAMTVGWLQRLSTSDHPMAVTGLLAMAAGLLVSARAMALVQIDMFRRPARSSGPRGVPSDGGFVQASGFALRGFAGGNGLTRKPGGGIPIAVLGVVLAAYGFELLRQVDLCL